MTDEAREPSGGPAKPWSPGLLVPALLAGALLACAADLGRGWAAPLCASSAVLAAAARGARARIPLLGCALASLGAGRAAATRDEPSKILAALLEEPEGLVAVEGTALASLFPVSGKGGSVPIAVEAVGRGPGRTPARGKLLLRFDGTVEAVRRGDRIEALGRLRRPSPPTNPGERDAFAPKRARGIHGILDAGEGAIRRLQSGSPLSLLGAVDRLRGALARRATERLSPEAGALANAILLGVRDPAAADLLDLHARTGTLHFLAVSGVHSLLVAGGIRALLRLARATPGVEAVVLLVVLGVYAGLTGFNPPVVRACAMLAVLVAAPLLRRPADPVGPFALSAFLGALVDSRAVGEASFQLSHAAALSIALFGPAIARALGAREPSPEPLPMRSPLLRMLAALDLRTRRLLAISLAASLATAPLLFHHFGTLVLWSAPFSLLLAPVVALLLPLGYVLVLAPEPLAGVLAFAFETVVRLEVAVLRALDRLPGTPWTPLDVSTTSVVLACGASIALLAGASARRWRLSIPLAIACVTFHFPWFRSEGLRLAVLDIGHGTAVACVAPDRRAVLFDLGSAERFALARNVLLPYLRDARARRVEAVVLSHPDADHWNGIPDLLGYLEPSLVVHRAGTLPGVLRLPSGTRTLGIDTGRIDLDVGGARFSILAPAVEADASENDWSLALEVSYAGRSILLTGDPEDRGLHALSRAFTGIPDVLLAPHHGLAAAGLSRFVGRLAPRRILVSAGRRFDPEPTLRKWRREGRDVLVTRESGAILVDVSPDGRLSARSLREKPVTTPPQPP